MLSFLNPSFQRREIQVAPQRPRAPELYNPVLRRFFGEIDFNHTSIKEQREHYAGLFRSLLDFRAENIATAMMEATVQVGDPQGDSEADFNHPWYRLLRNLNNNYELDYLYTWIQLAKDLGNGAFFAIERDAAGAPLFAHPVFPWFGEVRPVGAEDGGIGGYIFISRQSDKRFPWSVDNVIWVRHTSTTNPYDSAPLLESDRDALNLSRFLIRKMKSEAETGGVPPFYLQSLGADQPALKKLSERFESYFLPHPITGQRKKKIPAFDEQTDIKSVGQSNKDMEATASLDWIDDYLFKITKVHKGLFSENATEANSKSARKIFAESVVEPQARRNMSQIEGAMKRIFGGYNPDGTVRSEEMVLRTFIHVPDQTPPDPDFELKKEESRVRSGIWTRDQVLLKEGGEPLPDGLGSQPTVEGFPTPLSQIVQGNEERAQRFISDSVTRAVREAIDIPYRKEESKKKEAAPLRALPNAFIKADHIEPYSRIFAGVETREDAEEAIATAWRQADRFRFKVIDRLRGIMRRFIRGEAIDIFVDALDVGGIVESEVLDALRVSLNGTAEEALPNVIKSGFDYGAEVMEIPLTFDAQRPGVRRVISQLVGKLETVPETLFSPVRRIVEDGLAEGIGTDEMASLIRKEVEGLADWEARRIAQTTGTGGFEAGQVESFREAGVDAKQWVSSQDGKVRASHLATDGEIVGIEETFSNGLKHPGDPEGSAGEVINCRCSTFAAVLEDQPGTASLAGVRLATRAFRILRTAPDREPRKAGHTEASWKGRRNDYIRSEFQHLSKQGMKRDDACQEISDGDFEGEPLMIGPRQVRRIVKGH